MGTQEATPAGQRAHPAGSGRAGEEAEPAFPFIPHCDLSGQAGGLPPTYGMVWGQELGWVQGQDPAREQSRGWGRFRLEHKTL